MLNFGPSCLQRHSRSVDENDTDDWASTEFGEANLGDARLAQRLVALARPACLQSARVVSTVAQAAELKAAYRS